MGQKHVDCALLVYIVSCIPVNVASFAWGTCVHTGRQLRVRRSHDLHACFFDIESNLCSLGSLVSVFQNRATTGKGEDALRLCISSGQGVVDFSNRTDSFMLTSTNANACMHS